MNNLLQNLQQNLQKIPQSAKVLAVAGLLAAALVTWYLIAFRPAQDPALAVAPTPTQVQPAQPVPVQPSGSAVQPGQAQPIQPGQAQPQTAQGQTANPTPAAARPLEVVPLPFLRADGSAPTTASAGGNNPNTAQANPSGGSGSTSVAAAPARPALPPNPFAPLITENQTPPATTPASGVPTIQGPGSRPVPTAQPMPTQQARVQISSSGTGLPRIPGLPGSRSTPTVTQTPNVPVVTNRPNQNQGSGQVRTNNSTSLPQTGNLNSGNTGNTTRPNANSNTGSNAVAQVRPGGTVRLTPGGSANTAPGAITPGTGALPIRIAPLERELVTTRPAAVIQTPTPAPLEPAAATPTPQTPAQPAEVVIETPAVGALDTDSAGPQSNFNPDFTQVQPGGRTTPRPEIRSSTAQPQRPPAQTQQQTPTDPPVKVVPPNPIEEYVKAQNLRLANVVLGSTNVAIFQSRDGFLVLPVGSTLPNSEILIRSLNAREALLVQGSDELNLPVQNP